MATFNATFFVVQNAGARGVEHAAPRGKGALGLAALTTSTTAATAQRGGENFVAPSDGYLLCRADGDVRVATGETAARGASPVGVFMAADETLPVSIAAGETVSVIDA